jgi:hypothetical protein
MDEVETVIAAAFNAQQELNDFADALDKSF